MLEIKQCSGEGEVQNKFPCDDFICEFIDICSSESNKCSYENFCDICLLNGSEDCYFNRFLP